MNKLFATMTLLALAMAGCSSPTPGLCCTDQADCAAAGLPTGSTCNEGLACRGHQCVAEVCEKAADCDATAPYCRMDGPSGLCTARCSEDAQCPGAAQDASQVYCASGTCVVCRTDSDCAADAPICDIGVCRGCQAHSECPAQVCAMDGTCASEAEIVHAAPTGESMGDCGPLVPCTIAHALEVTPPRQYILAASGNYTSADTITVSGKRSIIGSGPQRPIITSTGAGPIFSVGSLSEVTLDGLQIVGSAGDGVDCDAGLDSSPRALRIVDSLISQHKASGVYGRDCSVTAIKSVFESNRIGVSTSDSIATFDRCTVDNNMIYGLDLDGGLIDLTNSFMYRNGIGLLIYPSRPGTRVEFNTIVDNTQGVSCVPGGVSSTKFSNNIISRNQTNVDDGASCTYPGSIITNNISQLHFVQPDTAPYDYHLGAGSIAIDAAADSTVDHDFDGEARPKGKGRDVGADEAQ